MVQQPKSIQIDMEVCRKPLALGYKAFSGVGGGDRLFRRAWQAEADSLSEGRKQLSYDG